MYIMRLPTKIISANIEKVFGFVNVFGDYYLVLLSFLGCGHESTITIRIESYKKCICISYIYFPISNNSIYAILLKSYNKRV